jgi:hypothetical protein
MKESVVKYDFIFLDGLHTGKRVCQELELALDILEPNGVIILHDYYPNIQELVEGKEPISGPFTGVERFKTKNNIKVIPLGKLPWNTIGNSYYTSLALVTK